MTQDHYAILGVTPTAEPAVIRAAYLALMREYHPDRNDSPAAIARAQAIIAAFKVLGDFDSRNQYDWDRRREREQAQAAAATRPRRGAGTAVVGVGAIGLAAIGAVLMRPSGPAEIAVGQPTVIEKPRAKSAPPIRAEAVDPPAPRAVEPIQKSAMPDRRAAVPASSHADELDLKRSKIRVAQLALSRAKAAERKPDGAKPNGPEPKPVVAIVRPPKVKLIPTPKPATEAVVNTKASGDDLASLDQFVMSFYGQSWRYGDARKRIALEHSRSGFVARRGACLADACKRAAYLKLMREVSEIVESK